MLPPLSDYVRKSLKHIKAGYEDETIYNAIADYYSMKGEFDSEDLKTIYDNGYCAGDFVCNDDTPEEIVKCVRCGYQSDVEGDVMKADGCCPRCGNSTIVIYEKQVI